MFERLIQTIKRRVSVLENDLNWTSESLSTKLAKIIRNLRLIPSKTIKTNFEAHFGRKPNMDLSKKQTKLKLENLNYKNLQKYCLDERILNKPVLTEKQIWILDGTKEDELDNQNLDSPPRRVTSANYQLRRPTVKNQTTNHW